LIVLFHLAIVLSVLLQFMVSDPRFGIFKLFLFKTFCKNQLSEAIIIFVAIHYCFIEDIPKCQLLL